MKNTSTQSNSRSTKCGSIRITFIPVNQGGCHATWVTLDGFGEWLETLKAFKIEKSVMELVMLPLEKLPNSAIAGREHGFYWSIWTKVHELQLQ